MMGGPSDVSFRWSGHSFMSIGPFFIFFIVRNWLTRKGEGEIGRHRRHNKGLSLKTMDDIVVDWRRETVDCRRKGTREKVFERFCRSLQQKVWPANGLIGWSARTHISGLEDPFLSFKQLN